MNNFENSFWCYLPGPILIQIFEYLNARDLLNAGLVCHSWYSISLDDLIWKKIFYRTYKVDKNMLKYRNGNKAWKSEYKRLFYEIPTIETEVLTEHNNQVLHVSFSHNGKYFATCSKDGYVYVWRSEYPSRIKYYYNMRDFQWRYTQYSQFNESDTKLLISGVLFGSSLTTTGEIAIFGLIDGFRILCRVENKPYDVFGTWITNEHILSGNLHWLPHFVNVSELWMNKASQETSSEHIAIVKKLFNFYNANSSSIRSLMVADCEKSLNQQNHKLNDDYDETDCASYDQTKNVSNYDEYSDDEHLMEHDKIQTNENVESPKKIIIFTTGSKTYTPHEIAFKKLNSIDFPYYIDVSVTLEERVALRKQREREIAEGNESPDLDWTNYDSVKDKFDKIDHKIDLNGHIIGMRLSPDHRYLYVNCRPWPKNCTISNPIDPPPIAQEIDIHVIDLHTLQPLEKMFRAHKAYTPNSECFFIFLDVCDEYVASGAENNHGYLWDRHYGICLAKYPHKDVVNAVAFNPSPNTDMLVTVSDDYSIKVWRSRRQIKKYNLSSRFFQSGILMYDNN